MKGLYGLSPDGPRVAGPGALGYARASLKSRSCATSEESRDRVPDVRSLNQKRFERFLEPWLPDLRRLALRLTGSPDDADDLVADLVERLYPRMHEIAQLEQPRPWLTRVLYRLFIDRWRHQRSGPERDNEALLDDQASRDDAPEAAFERALTQERLQRALDELPAQQRELVILYDVEGYGLTELAEITGTAVGTLKSRLHRARLRLRERLLDGTESGPDS